MMNIINFNNNKCLICFENIIGESELNCGHKYPKSEHSIWLEYV
jgi:hypothetical protein